MLYSCSWCVVTCDAWRASEKNVYAGCMKVWSMRKIPSAAIVGAFFYPMVYIIPFFLYGIWLRYLRITKDPFGRFGWDEGDVDVVKVFDGHILNSILSESRCWLRCRHRSNQRSGLIILLDDSNRKLNHSNPEALQFTFWLLACF